MPMYQYQCTDCGEGLEVRQSFSDDALTECPACGGRLRKVFGAVGVMFKGSGFYRNDSRAGGGSEKAASSGSSDASSGSGSSDASSGSGSSGSSSSTTSNASGSSSSSSAASTA